MTMTENGNDLRDRHIGELISQLGSDTSTLVRQEMELARAELRERVDAIRDEVTDAMALARSETSQNVDRAKADIASKGKKAGAGIGMFGVAGVASLLGLGAVTAALVLLLHRWLDADLAALIVAAAWGLIAAAAALRGRDKLHEAGGLSASQYLPRETIETVKHDMKRLGDVNQLKPEHTIETVKEDVEWAKTRGKSDAR
jgi:hypothetical protein